jgi:FKBP-type peptidyl-prolyl cis-trans isomerase SlyD
MAILKDQMVTMNYELKINDEVLDTNIDADPIEFKYEHGKLIPGLESQISNMNEGETKKINILADDAYGQYNDELSETLPISDFEGIDLQIGMVLEADGENEERFRATVTEITKEEVTVDYNHPLAGSDLEFTVIIKTIN